MPVPIQCPYGGQKHGLMSVVRRDAHQPTEVGHQLDTLSRKTVESGRESGVVQLSLSIVAHVPHPHEHKSVEASTVTLNHLAELRLCNCERNILVSVVLFSCVHHLEWRLAAHDPQKALECNPPLGTTLQNDVISSRMRDKL